MTERKLQFRQVLVLLAGAGIYAVLYAFCSQIDQSGVTVPGAALPRFMLAFPVALAVLAGLFHFVLPLFEMKRTEKKFCTWGAWVLLFCCYVPMFLIQYPGSFTYDILSQSRQVAAESYDSLHPVLHTLLLRWCINAYGLVGSFERCVALCNVIQMVVVSGCFASICASISRSVSWRAALIALVFFALYPTHMALASTYTKDVMFSSFFALFMTLHAEAAAKGYLSFTGGCLYVISGVLCSLLRNNMLYAMAAWIVLLGIAQTISKRHRHLLLGVLLVVILSLMGRCALHAAVQSEKGHVREFLSVPAQQMARARLLELEMLTEQECKQMDDLFDGVNYAKYDPTLADPIKDYLNRETFENNPLAAIRLWAEIGAKCPRIYLDAFLNMALPSLYPYSEYRVSADYIEVGECREGLTNPFGMPQIQQPRRFAAIREWLNVHIFDTGMDDVPVLRYLFNTGFIFWVLLLCVLYAMYAGEWHRVLWMLLPVLLWGTYLLGPVMQGRYLYPFVCVLPVFMFRPGKCAGRED